MKKDVTEGDLIQVNEDGPSYGFRCILVIDEVMNWGVKAYCTVPEVGGLATDAFMRLEWHEFDVLGAKSKFIVMEAVEAKEKPNDELDVGADSDRGHGAAAESAKA